MIRYSKQIILSDIGITGQNKLKNSKVLCVGIGGLGSSVLMYLSSMGIGTIGIVDMDNIELSNLHRQVIYNTTDLGKNKVKIAKKYVEKLNPSVVINTYNLKLIENNIINIIRKYNIVIDCTDNLETKYLINKYAMKFNIPMVYGALFGFEGYVSVFIREKSCYFCLYKNIPSLYVPTCSESGVLGVVAGIIGNIQALETVKLILNDYNSYDNEKFSNLISKLLIFDSKFLSFKILNFSKNDNCPICNISLLSNKKKNIYIKENNDFFINHSNLKNNIDIKIIDIRKNNIFYAKYIKHIDKKNVIKISLNDLMDLNNISNIIIKSNKYAILCDYSLRSKFICNFLRSNGYNNIFYLK